MKLRSNFRTDWPLLAPVRHHSSIESFERRMYYATTLLLAYRNVYPPYVHRATYVMMCDTLVKHPHFARERSFQICLQYLIYKWRCVFHSLFVRSRGEPDTCRHRILPPRLKKRVSKIHTLTTSAIARRRWKVLKAASRFLALHSRAVVTANHPNRKRRRCEFVIEDE